MRLAVVTSALPADTGGGAERYAVMLAEALAPRHEVTLITASAADAPPGMAVERVPPAPPFNPAGSRLHKLAWHGRDQWRPSVYRAMRGLLDRLRPEVMHTNNLQGMSASAFSAIARAGVPHVHTAHDFNLLCVRVNMTQAGKPCDGRCLDCRVQRGVRGRAIRSRLDTLIAPSDFARERHVAYGIAPPERAITLRQGAPPGRTALRGRGPLVRFGYLGALAAHKGVRTLLAAVRDLEGPWELHLAGEGPLLLDAQGAAHSDSRITCHGTVDGPAKEAFFNALDVLVLPSECEENAPLVVAEATIRGIPVVVSDRGGLAESPCAWTVPASDVRALAATLRRLSSTPEAIEERSRLLLAEPKTSSWDQHVQRVERILEAASGETDSS